MSRLVGFLCLPEMRGWSLGGVSLCCCCVVLASLFCCGTGHGDSGCPRRDTRRFMNLRFLVRVCPDTVLITYLRCGQTSITVLYISHI